MKSFYCASKFENVGPVREAHAMLRAAGWQITYDWTRSDDKALAGDELALYLEQQALADFDGVQNADVFLILGHPGMRGAFVELGIALAQGIPVHVVGREHVEQIFLHLPKTIADIFFHGSIASAVAVITGGPVDAL